MVLAVRTPASSAFHRWGCGGAEVSTKLQDHTVDQDANPMFLCITQEASPFLGTLKISLNWPGKIFVFRLSLSNRCDWI